MMDTILKHETLSITHCYSSDLIQLKKEGDNLVQRLILLTHFTIEIWWQFHFNVIPFHSNQFITVYMRIKWNFEFELQYSL